RHLDARHAHAALAPSQRRRPAGAQGRRLRRARAARRRPLRRARAAHRGHRSGRGEPRVPGHRVRAEQARPARRPAVRCDGGAARRRVQAGAYVGQEQPGVGRCVELVQRTVGTGAAAASREYLVIEYAPSKRGQPGDRLFVPTESLDQVTKYTGGEAPSLNRMGGADWAKTKGRARKAVKEIAAELIRLYAARMATKGHAFGP